MYSSRVYSRMTSYSVHSVMPGSFSFDTTLHPKLDINVGAKSHFFQPPKTPSACSALHPSTASPPSQGVGSGTSRKRTRHDSFVNQITPHSALSHSCSMASDTLSTSDASGAISPQPFVSTKYELAGGLDTPTAAALSGMDLGEDEENYRTSADLYLRGGRGFRGFDPTSNSYLPRSSSALAREGNGRPRVSAPPRIRDGVGRAVYNVVGVAGKVLEFCKAAAFRGFYAGGGQGYEIKAPTQAINGDQSLWLDADGEEVFQTYEKGVIPGRFPEEDYIPDYMSQDHITPLRPTKKVQRDKGVGEMSASWVMVGSGETSPSHLSHRKVPSANTPSRKIVPKFGKRPILPASRPSLTSYAGSPGLRPERPASFASARSPVSSPRHESPVSIDMQRHAARIRKRELEEDANLKRFNSQLKAMIKEGKEALGTKFEVEDGPIDEGYAEGDYFYETGKR